MGYDASTDFKMTAPDGSTIHLRGLTPKLDTSQVHKLGIEKHDTVAKKPKDSQAKPQKNPKPGGAGSGHKPKATPVAVTKPAPKAADDLPSSPKAPKNHRPWKLRKLRPRTTDENRLFCGDFATKMAFEKQGEFTVFNFGVHYGVKIGDDEYMWVTGTPGKTPNDPLIHDVWISNRAYCEDNFTLL